MTDYTEATKKQLRAIIESDWDCPTPLLYQAFEEMVKRDGYGPYINKILVNRYGSIQKIEQLTKMTADEIKWFLYEKGFGLIEKFKQGNPFLGLWSRCIQFTLRDLVRDNKAQKRTADLVEIDSEEVYVVPVANCNTEKIVMDRMQVEYLFSKMTDTEKEIFLMRDAGYYMHEIWEKQGVTKTGIQRRIELCIKRIKSEGA